MRLNSIFLVIQSSSWPEVLKEFTYGTAQNLRHMPVDELHSIENKALKIANDFLTLFLDAVQHTRSLTVSKVFPVGGESGAQASSLRPSTDLEVISESSNGSCWRQGTAVPRCESANSHVSFLARRCWGGIKLGAREGDKAWRAQLFRCSIVVRRLSRASAQSGAWAVRSL